MQTKCLLACQLPGKLGCPAAAAEWTVITRGLHTHHAIIATGGAGCYLNLSEALALTPCVIHATQALLSKALCLLILIVEFV